LDETQADLENSKIATLIAIDEVMETSINSGTADQNQPDTQEGNRQGNMR